MRLKLVEGQRDVGGGRIAEHMQVAIAEIDNALTIWAQKISVADIPFVGDFPVEAAGAARHLVQCESRRLPLQVAQRVAYALARQAATDREQIARPSIHAIMQFRRPRRQRERRKWRSLARGT